MCLAIISQIFKYAHVCMLSLCSFMYTNCWDSALEWIQELYYVTSIAYYKDYALIT